MKYTNSNKLIFDHIKTSRKCPNTSYTYDKYGFIFILDEESYLSNGKNNFTSIINFDKLDEVTIGLNKFKYYIKKNIDLIKTLNTSLDKKNETWSWTIDCSNVNSLYKLSKIVSIIHTLYNEGKLTQCKEIKFIELNKMYGYYINWKLYGFNLKYTF
jgi:hypothetical protein